MKKSILLMGLSALLISLPVMSQTPGKLVSTKTHIKFFSHTAVEDIQANNYASVSTIEPATGDVVFSVPMQSFEFEKALMQKHFNGGDFLDTQKEPKAKLKAKITNNGDIDYKKDGTYSATVAGELTIKGVTKPVNEKGTVVVKGGLVNVQSVFKVALADYGVTFSKGKPSTNIAKEVEVTVHAEYKSE